MSQDTSHPRLQYNVEYPESLSRLLIFVKSWLLAIPHFIVLAVLGVAAWIVTIIAWFAILITGRYPEGMWRFVLGVFRWGARVQAYVLLQRDEYPPFSFDGDYPVHLDLQYPERLNRWLVLIKWLLIIPHYIVLYILQFIAQIITFIAWFAILFTGRYPRSMFDFIVGYQRWNSRVYAYLFLLTDDYPPFTFDNDTSNNYSGSPSGAPQPTYYR
jgi:hypothetical protein